MLCVLHPSCDVMLDGARMTVRSRPTSKHVPRKERRYHVKTKEPANFSLDEFLVSSNVQFWRLRRHKCLYQCAAKSEGKFLAQIYSNAPPYKLHISCVALEMLIVINHLPIWQFMNFIVLKSNIFRLRLRHYIGLAKNTGNKLISEVQFGIRAWYHVTKKIWHRHWQNMNMDIHMSVRLPPCPTKLRGVWRENKSRRFLDLNIKWRWAVDITFRPSVPQQRIITRID